MGKQDIMAGLKHIFVLLLPFFSCCSSYLVDNNPYRHIVTLDPKGKYQLEWLVDFDTKQVTFNVTVQTTGYVGFGLSRKGKMPGADLIIGGVLANGVPYFSDRHAIANQLPVEDTSQDWKLHEAWERSGKTFLSFSRAFDTCDEDHDLPITNDLTSVIWAYSEVDDDLQYHFQNRGNYDVYLLDPDLVPRNIEDVSRGGKLSHNVSLFNITTTFRMPPQDTTYWCTFHKLPTSKKHHVIGMNTAFPTEQDRQHVHHFLLHRCRAPPGVNPAEFFEGPSRSGGSECYILERPNPLPLSYCREVVHVWGFGGRAVFFPDHVGLPMSAEAEDQYWMLQVHYDNPNNLTNIPITASLELYYTENLRENDVGLLQLGDIQPGSTTLLLPPSDPNHIIMGHCAPGCTDRIIGPSGEANVFATFLHTHRTGRGVRSMHFRNGRELPRIQWDDNYNFAYQQVRILREEHKILPGDLLLSRCQYDNTDRNGSVVTGGFSTREEMCSVFMYYYNRSPGFSLCRSEINTDNYFDLLGIQNVTWIEEIRQTVVSPPHRLAGMTMQDYANNHINWDLKTRKRLQSMQIYEPQVSRCPRFFYDNAQTQLEEQLRGNILRNTGRLPGSDGRAYFSVDDDTDHESVFPKNQPRWMPEPQCSRRKQIDITEESLLIQ